MQAITDIGHTLKWTVWVPWTFFMGLAFGSFLNVCIYRLPRGMNVARPRSACPKCHATIAALDNIPVLSWFLLRGKCRQCKQPISPRYWIVELMVGILFATSVAIYGIDFCALKLCILSFLLVGLIFTDADLKLLPDAMTKPGIVIGLAMSLFCTVDDLVTRVFEMHNWIPAHMSPEMYFRTLSLLDSLAGALLGAGFIWGVAKAYKMLRGVEGMGFGDVKLMGMIGTFLGAHLALYTIMGASIVGSFAGMTLMLNVYRKRLVRRRVAETPAEKKSRAWRSAQLVMRHYEMPFGIFLGGAALFLTFLYAIKFRMAV